jgi:hypothetical protein
MELAVMFVVGVSFVELGKPDFALPGFFLESL